MTAADELRATIAEQFPETVEQLTELVRIPGIAFPDFPRGPVDDAAALVVRLLADAGCANVRLLENGPNPSAVYAEVPGPPGSPVVLLYAHYDVQPAGDESLWDSPPFEPEIREGRMYGRGAADDKSGVILHAAVVRAFAGQPPCTLRIIIEGDEEYGGSFDEFPRTHPEMFEADVLVIADTGNIETGVPTLTVALRGMAVVTVSVRTLDSAVHSGMFGGPAPDALMALITLLATLRDANGDTAIAGVPGGEWEGTGYDEDTFREMAGVIEGQPLVGSGSLASRLITRPAVSVIGLDAPSVSGAINAVIPEARATVSLRVPPSVDPLEAQQALIDHLFAQAPWGVQVSVAPGSSGEGFAARTDGPGYAAIREAMAGAYGQEAVDAGSGGSIPLVSVLAEVAPQADIILFGAQDTAAAIHAPNESLDLGELQKSILTEALFLVNLAQRADGLGADESSA